MYILHQLFVLFLSSPTAPSSTMCMQTVVLTGKKYVSSEHGQSDSWIAVDQVSIDV